MTLFSEDFFGFVQLYQLNVATTLIITNPIHLPGHSSSIIRLPWPTD